MRTASACWEEKGFRGQVGAQEDTRYEDAEIVEDFDISGLLVHHVDAVLASVVYAEADVEVVVLVDGDSRFGLRREIRSDQRGGSFGHGSALHAPGDRGNIGLDDVVEQFVELYLVLLVLTHGDRDDALFAREFGLLLMVRHECVRFRFSTLMLCTP